MSSSYLNRNNFACAFDEIVALLERFEPLWRGRAFIQDTLSWQPLYPELHEQLLALDEAQLEALNDEEHLLAWLMARLPGSEALQRWTAEPYEGDVRAMAKFADVGIKGRKVEQITRFASALEPMFATDGGQILDWCSGKGHLAKQLHHVSGLAVTCLEYNAHLCRDGAVEANKLGYPLTFIEQDVLEALPDGVLDKANVHTALHACGDLHISMMKTAVGAEAEHIALSPCCYHLSRNDEYRPMSQLGRQKGLSLDLADLRLAVSQTVTAGRRVRNLRRKELVWRIAFDLWHRRFSGVDCYRPTPSIAKQWLSGSFEQYCRKMIRRVDLPMPEVIDSEELLAAAEAKFRRIERLEKVRLAFRRAMEYYLVLDRVLYLYESGYEVALKQFCSSQVTPRNLLICASKV